MVVKELAELKFLDPKNTAAVGRYEGMLTFITGRNGVSRADMQDYLRDGISSLVDKKFSEVYVFVRGYYTVHVIYNQETKNYKLAYTKNENDIPKEIPANDLPELKRKLTASGIFRAEDINLIINDKAPKIPSYVYSVWVEKGLTRIDGVTLIKQAIANFYTAPIKANYDVLVGIYANYWLNGGGTVMASFEHEVRVDFDFVMSRLSQDISKQIYLAVDGRQVSSDTVKSIAAALIKQNPDYRVFSIAFNSVR
jgi:hypothetical protein